MLTLYTTPGACSLAAHIALEASGLDYQTVHVDLANKTIDGGADYLQINPKGAVPALDIGGGEVLTENAVLLTYIADKSGSEQLLPASGVERYRVLEWTNFVATEMHKGLGALFVPLYDDNAKAVITRLVEKKLDHLERALGDKPFLTGDAFRICDAYLFVILRWTDIFRIDLTRWAKLAEYRQRVAALPFAATVLQQEGLGG